MTIRNRNSFEDEIYFIYLVVSCLCLVSTVKSQLPQQETYDYCDRELELCEVFTDHVMCKYPVPGLSSQCSPTIQEPLTTTEKKRILFWHNKFRSNVANGTEKNKTRKLPTSSNMRQIYWDFELETLAERWANQCVSTTNPRMYDDCRNTKRFQVSQNVGTRQVNATTIDKQAPQIVITWYKGNKDFDPSLVEKFVPIEKNPVSTVQFANLIRAETFAIGCARIIFQEQNKGNESVRTIERLVCNYGPGGNQYGKPLYKRGLSCTECPAGTICSRVFPGLCAVQYKPENQQNLDNNEIEKETSPDPIQDPKEPKKPTPVTEKISEEASQDDEQDYRFFSPTLAEITEEEECEGEECHAKTEEFSETPNAPDVTDSRKSLIDNRRHFEDIIKVAKPSARKKSREVGFAVPSQMETFSGKEKWAAKNEVPKIEEPLKNGDECVCYLEMHRTHSHDDASRLHPLTFITFISSFVLYFLLL